MHKHPKLIFLVTVLVFLLAAVAISHPTFAVDNVVETTFFGNLQDDGEGCGVFTILNSVVDILSIGVGILAAIGITIVGIKYLTAKGDIAQTKKAKHRMFQIVLGLVAYVLLYAGVQWLLPGGKLNTSQQCNTISNQELATLKAQEKQEQQEKAKQQKADSSSISSSTDAATNQCMKKAAKVVRDKICKLETPAERLSQTAILLAGSASKPSKNYVAAMEETKTTKGESGCRAKGQACGMFVGTTVRAAGIDPKFPTMASRIYPYVKKSKDWKEVSTKNPKPGDISLSYFSGGDAGHVSIYVKNKKGKTVTAQASLCDFYGVVESKAYYTGSSNKTYRYVGK